MFLPFLAIAIVLVLDLVLLWRREPRSLLNAGVFGIAVVFAYLGLMEVAFYNEWAFGAYAWLTLGLVIGLPLLYLIGSLVLIWNGRTMAQREGISLSHMLAPVVGVFPILVVVALVGVIFISLVGNETVSGVGMLLISVACGIYAYLLWNAFCLIGYGAVNTAMPKSQDPDYIIVHGAGLIDGKVPPLLAGRLDKAIEVYHRGGDRAIIIPSGGHGDDEPTSEAFAMSAYLMDHSIPAEHIVPEDQSTDTDENMRFSKEIVARIGTPASVVIFVTSSYHVFGTALIARKAGLKAQGVGSRTARYYLPSAIIREFIAILVMYKWWYIAPFIAAAGIVAVGGIVTLIGG